jgi:hypothetical protein
MSSIFGALGLNDTDRVYASTLGQRVIVDAINQVFKMHNAEVDAALAVFVREITSDFKERYKLPAGGRLDNLGFAPQGQAGAGKTTGAWDVAFPLTEYGRQLAADRVSWAYMTVQDLDRHLDTVMTQNINTVRFELLKSLLNNTQRTFVDPLHGSLSVEPLANGDTVVYPPVLGSESETTDNHYLESGYAASAISDTNDPLVTVVDELEEHFGSVTGGSNIAVFINNAQRAKTADLTDYTQEIDRQIQPGTQTAIPVGLPMSLPGRILGRHAAGAWIVEWRWIPANYMVAVHMDAPAPLKQRRDPEDTGLQPGLQLVSESETHPFSASHYSNRFGFGAANRLNGVVLELGTGGTYSIPSGYS